MKCRCLAVDGVVMDRLSRNGKLILIRRKNPPHKGALALPGGFVELNESAEEAVVREVREETGVEGEVVAFLGLFSAPYRDVRGTASALFLLKGDISQAKAMDDAKEVVKLKLEEALRAELAFDHSEMVRKAYEFLAKGREKD